MLGVCQSRVRSSFHFLSFARFLFFLLFFLLYDASNGSINVHSTTTHRIRLAGNYIYMYLYENIERVGYQGQWVNQCFFFHFPTFLLSWSTSLLSSCAFFLPFLHQLEVQAYIMLSVLLSSVFLLYTRTQSHFTMAIDGFRHLCLFSGRLSF